MPIRSRAPVRRLAVARLISITGGAAAYLALNYSIYQRTHSPAWVAAALFLTFGTVFNESSFLYRPEKSVSDYLAQAGGPRREADERSIYVLRADGSVISKRGTGLLVSSLDRMRPMPGDAIVVPEDLTRTTLTKDLKDWTQIFYQFGLGAAALKVISKP